MSETFDPAAGLLNEENQLFLEQCLARLGPKDREVIELRYWKGLTYRESAERLGIPENTVSSRLHTAVQRLRKIIEDRDI